MNTNDPNFFPMSKIPDLVWQLFQRVVSYDQIREMKDEGKILATKYANRYYVQVDSLEQWLGCEPGKIRSQYNGGWTGWS